MADTASPRGRPRGDHPTSSKPPRAPFDQAAGKPRAARAAGPGPDAADPGDELSRTATAVADLIARGEPKRAIEKAKELHREHPSADSERLLADAYVARIQSFPVGMGTEAYALMELAASRYPGARERFDALRPVLAARHDRLEELLRPIADPETAPAVRAAVDASIRSELSDLGGLAESPLLPRDHGLRVAAAAIRDAFAAVTSRPVKDEELLLAEVSRRSPLAPWKPLLRAVASFHRSEDAECDRHLAAVARDAAPARLVPTLRALMGPRPDGREAPARASLRAAVSGTPAALWRALEELDRALARKELGKIVQGIRGAVRQCARSRPELLDRLRQRISIRCLLAQLPVERVRTALGGMTPRDAHFFRLFARASEIQGDLAAACRAWEDFRRHAVSEGRFDWRSAESAGVCLHAAELLEHVPYKQLDDELHPQRFFREACACDPRSEHFRRWLQWARTNDHWKLAEEAALAWHEALPDEARPLLHLTEACERRSAFAKALRYLEKAENLDRLDPEVGRARHRLLAAILRRHLQQENARLAAKDIEKIAALPEVQSGPQRALVAALRWILSLQVADGRYSHWRSEVSRESPSELAASVLAEGLAAACGLASSRRPLPSPDPRTAEPASLARAVAEVCALCDGFGLPLDIPNAWANRLRAGLASPSEPPEPPQLRALAEAALRRRLVELAYAASGAGLHVEEQQARFLLLRAQSLPPWSRRRRKDCLRAAAELAGRQRDLSLVGEIGDATRFGGLGDPFDLDARDERLDTERLTAIVARERDAVSYPDWTTEREETSQVACGCSRCRGGPTAADVEELEEDDEDDELERTLEDGAPDGEAPMVLPRELANLPPKLQALLLEMALKHGTDADGPDMDEVARIDPELYARFERAATDHVLKGGTLPGSGRHARGSRKRRKRRKKGSRGKR